MFFDILETLFGYGFMDEIFQKMALDREFVKLYNEYWNGVETNNHRRMRGLAPLRGRAKYSRRNAYIKSIMDLYGVDRDVAILLNNMGIDYLVPFL